MKKMTIMLLFAAVSASTGLAQDPEAPPAQKNWSGRVELGYVQSTGNTESILSHLFASAKRQTANNTFQISSRVTYGESDGEKNVDKGFITANNKHFYSPNSFVYCDASLEYDEFQRLDVRSKIGTGIGHRFISTETSRLDCSGGIRWIDEDYEGSEDDDRYGAGAVGLDYERKFSDRVTFCQKISVDISMEDMEDVLATSETSLRTALTRNLGLAITLLDKYDANPPRSLKENDSTLITSLTYSF